jgi:hypothetical protein
MKSSRLELRVEPELLARVDDARGDVSRTRFVERALESALKRRDAALEPYPFEAGRRAVREAVDRGAASVRVEAGSVVPGVVRASSLVKRDVRPIPKKSR